MTRFRPCIDLHAGSVKQIVGGTLTTTDNDLKTNYVSELPAGHYAKLYKDNGLHGAHVIMLGPGNENAAKEACAAWPIGLQVGGGVNDGNARQWIEWGAEKVDTISLLYHFSRGIHPSSSCCLISQITVEPFLLLHIMSKIEVLL